MERKDLHIFLVNVVFDAKPHLLQLFQALRNIKGDIDQGPVSFILKKENIKKKIKGKFCKYSTKLN